MLLVIAVPLVALLAAVVVAVNADVATRDATPVIANLEEMGKSFAHVTKKVSPA